MNGTLERVAGAAPGKSVAVLGGGISGLATAYYLSRLLAKQHSAQGHGALPTRIHLLEASARPGGWISSVKQGGFHFEQGPRTLRTAGIPGRNTLDLIATLGLQDRVVKVLKTSPAAQARFLYHNDTLQALPRTFASFILRPPPVLRGFVSALLREPFVERRSFPPDAQDESIRDFVARRLGPDLADNVVSAVVHGIFSGDSRALSVRSCFPVLWNAEQRHGSIIKGMVFGRPEKDPPRDEASSAFINAMANASIYTFGNGLSELSEALVSALEKDPAVTIQCNAACSSIQRDNTITLADKRTLKPDVVVSCLPANRLGPLLAKTSVQASALLSSIPYSNVGVVNLGFDRRVLSVKGFGYLVPRTQASDVLGCIFDSCVVPSSGAKAGGDRLTVMMGGPRFREIFGDPATADPDILLSRARASLKKHLGIVTPPAATHVTLSRDCIPQYLVGHHAKLQELHGALTDWNRGPGRLLLAGSAFSGVGINDVILNGKGVASDACADLGGNPMTTTAHPLPKTGLERVLAATS